MPFALIVILVMVSAILAVQLGLTEAVMKVVVKITKCHKCLTFWGSLVILWIAGCNIIIAILLSLLGAYLSEWAALAFAELAKEYERLWHELNKQRKRSGK